MPAPHERPPEGDGRKRMPRIPESGEEKAARRSTVPRSAVCGLRSAQTISATARTISLRDSAVQAIGVIISVPTPASR